MRTSTWLYVAVPLEMLNKGVLLYTTRVRPCLTRVTDTPSRHRNRLLYDVGAGLHCRRQEPPLQHVRTIHGADIAFLLFMVSSNHALCESGRTPSRAATRATAPSHTAVSIA